MILKASSVPTMAVVEPSNGPLPMTSISGRPGQNDDSDNLEYQPSITESHVSMPASSRRADSIEVGSSGMDSAATYLPYSGHEKDSTPTLSFKESLGPLGFISILGGQIGILAITGFLAFLWFGYGEAPEAALATAVWRRIALRGWMTRVITLSSLALRAIISVQSTVCTSMIAALVLEKRFTRRSQVAYFSVLRSINDGPRRLLRMMLRSKTRAVFLQLDFWLLTLMVLVTLALQFSSTLLLSDINNFIIVGDQDQVQVPSLITYRQDDFDFLMLGGAIQSSLPTFMAFAEAPSGFDALPNIHGFSDTGLLQRGFLPLLGSDRRTSLRHFQGNLVTMKSRVSCMRPVIDGHFEYADTEYDSPKRFITGRLHYATSLQDAHASADPPCDSADCQELYFRCPVPLNNEARSNQYVSMPCLVGGVGGEIWGNNLDPKWDPAEAPWSVNSSIQLVVSTNMRRSDSASLLTRNLLGPGEPYEEWNSYELLPGRRVNATVCFWGFNVAREYVSISAQDAPREPIIEWAPTSTSYNTSMVQKYMGVDIPHRSHGERGILTMDIAGDPVDGPPDSIAHSVVTIDPLGRNEELSIANLTTRLLELFVSNSLTQGGVVNGSTVLCYFCDGYGYLTHPLFAMLFDSTIAETRRAANALQSYMTMSALSWYDSYINSLGELQPADMVTTRTVQTPGPCSSAKECAGFISVTTLVAVHFIYVTIITALCIAQVRYSRYNNIWHTISQLVTEELRDVLDRTDNVGDKIATSYSEASGDYRVKLGKLSDDERIGIHRLPEGFDQIPKSKPSLYNRLMGMMGKRRKSRIADQELQRSQWPG